VALDGGTRIFVDDENNVIKSGGVGVGGNKVNDSFTIDANGGQLFQPAITTGATGRQDD
jgi:hypothetical protein